MDFSDALRAVKDGKKVRRALWQEAADQGLGSYAEIVQFPDVQGAAVMPMVMVYFPAEHIWRPFSRSDWDVLDDDWEIAEP